MREIISDIAFQLHELKEDKPYLIITDSIIKDYIEDNEELTNKLIELVKEELEEL